MARHSEAVAKSYAKALFELARERSQVDAIGTELESVAAIIAEEPQLLAFLSRPWVAAPVKRGAAAELARHLGVSPLMRDFLGLIATRNRADHLSAIAAASPPRDARAEGRRRRTRRPVI